MSAGSPSRGGLRGKTSDLSDFFRGAGHSSLQTRQSNNDISTSSTPPMALDVQSSCDEGATPSKKKITRIPLFGRSRKKSTQSNTSSAGRYSSEGGELSSASRGPSTDRHPTEPHISVQPPPLPNKHNSSLTSKFAAHFSHTRSSKAVANQVGSASVKPAVESASLGLQAPGARNSSIESGSSSGTKSRSATPRPVPGLRPTITISLTGDDYDEYKDLFSRPGNDPPTPAILRGSKQRAGSESEAPLASTSARPSEGTSTYRRGQTPAAAIAAAVRQGQTGGNEQPPSPPPKSPKSSSDRKSGEPTDGSLTPRPYDSVRESPRLSETEKGLPPSLQRRASVAVGSAQFPESNSLSSRSRLKLPSSPSRTGPPSIPLPPPPTPSPPTPASNDSQYSKADSVASYSSSRANGSIRPRATTLSSAVAASRTSSRISRTPVIKPPTPPTPPLVNEKDGFNIETASADELRQALMDRNLQYDELATFVLKMTEAHVAEVTGLEKKIKSLESEVLKQEKTIQGMIHIIKEQDEKQQQREPAQKSHPPSAMMNNTRSAAAARGAESDPESAPSAVRRRLGYHSDSGAESYATSGAESIRLSGSGTDSLSSIFRNKKLRRPYPLGDSANAPSRMGSILRSSKIPPAAGPPEKSLPDVPSTTPKRSSMSSTSPSPSSSASSLLPPSPSITMSSLSAIPEGLASSLRPPRNTGSEPAEDRRIVYSSNRASTSSMTSSSTAASSSYSTQIKRSRPPSIAQVLEKSPKLDNAAVDRSRPFS